MLEVIVQDIHFSKNRYHYKLGKDNYPKAWFKLGIYSHLENTSKETQNLFREKLPPLPNILHTLKMPSELNKDIPVPQMRKSRANSHNIFETNIQGKNTDNEGFGRHIFNISSDKNFNNLNSDSIKEKSEKEKKIKEFQVSSSSNMGQFLHKAIGNIWQEMLNSVDDEKDKNWSFIFRIYTPALAMLESMITTDTFGKQQQQLALTLATLEGSQPTRISKLDSKQKNFRTWFAYITSVHSSSKQNLQIENAKTTKLDQSNGILNDKYLLSDDIFSEYRKHVGFYTSKSIEILGKELYKQGPIIEIEGHIQNFWSASNNQNIQGGLLKLMLNINDYLIPISYNKTVVFQETLLRDARQLNLLSSKLTTDGIEFLFEEEEIEDEIFMWIFNPFSSSGDGVISKLTKLSNHTPEIASLIEAIWNRLSNKYIEADVQLLVRLGIWCAVISPSKWKDYVSEEFYKKIILARENTKNETLELKLQESNTVDQVEHALLNSAGKRAREFYLPSTWTAMSLGYDKDMLFITDRISMFGTYNPSEKKVISTGYGLSQNVKWYPLSPEEYKYYNKNPITHKNRDLEQEIISNWTLTLQKCFDETIKLSETKKVQNSPKIDTVEESNLFIRNRISWLLIGKYAEETTHQSTREKFIQNLPMVEVIHKSVDSKISLNRMVLLGPSGWDLEFDSEFHKLIFSTSKPISKKLMKYKFKKLENFLHNITEDFGKISFNPERIKKSDFESQFSITLPDSNPLCKIDPFDNFDLWYDTYSEGLVEPNQDFLNHFDNGDWMDAEKAVNLLETLTNDAKTWIQKQSEMEKAELQKMYPSRLQCTIPDYQNYVDNDSIADIPLSRVRLHNSDAGSNVIGVLENNSDRIEKAGKHYTHIGNTLLVSSNAQRRGSRLNGWRLIGRGKDTDFLDYLERNWEDLFKKYNDCEKILIEEVVRTTSTNLDYDIPADLWLHKLHILYIISFYRATMSSDE